MRIFDFFKKNMKRTPWRSGDQLHNQAELHRAHPGTFDAFGLMDGLGHRVLSQSTAATADLDRLVGTSFLRRSATLFAGTRALLEQSAVESAKLTVRAQFELMLAARYLIHGGRPNVSLNTGTSERARLIRAKYFVAAGIRRKVYRREALLHRAWGGSGAGASRPGLQTEVDEYIEQLRTHYPVQHAKFGAFRSRPSKPKAKRQYHDEAEWYSFGFPRKRVNSIRALARRLGYRQDYEVLYAAYSALTHPKDYSQDLEIVGGRARVFSPHMAEAFDALAFYGLAYAELTLIWLAKAYAPASIADIQATSVEIRKATQSLRSDVPTGLFE